MGGEEEASSPLFVANLPQKVCTGAATPSQLSQLTVGQAGRVIRLLAEGNHVGLPFLVRLFLFDQNELEGDSTGLEVHTSFLRGFLVEKVVVLASNPVHVRIGELAGWCAIAGDVVTLAVIHATEPHRLATLNNVLLALFNFLFPSHYLYYHYNRFGR